MCNAAESLVVHEKIAEQFLPQLEAAINKVHPVEFRADQKALAIFKDAKAASEKDFATEYNDYIMSVNMVSSLDEAIDWVNRYTTHHSEAIVTKDLEHAERFQDEVDAAAVYVNASTRWICLWLGSRNWNFYPKNACAWSNGLRSINKYKILH